MNHPQQTDYDRQQLQYELEHQRLVAQCHALVAEIASRPGGTKLLRGVLPVLQQYAVYKLSRQQRFKGKER